MNEKAYLVLEDGTVFEGTGFGACTTTTGEVVFDTSMTGYQEMLTDPSFAGQLLTLTYPLVGNYGINELDSESERVQVRGLVVREHCTTPSHYQSRQTLHEYLSDAGIPGIADIDTRAVTRRLRSTGVMMGVLTREMAPEQALEALRSAPDYESEQLAQSVSTSAPYKCSTVAQDPTLHVALFDCGVKRSIIRFLNANGCDVTVLPLTTSCDEIAELKPNGVLLSPGPGDPAHLGTMEDTLKGLLGTVPIMAICLGHQSVARTLGARTFKLKFGHHGGNHPVKDIETGKVTITTQNHGYAVDDSTLPAGLEVSQFNLNDGTVEGLSHRDYPLLSIQYHAEGSPGPQDSNYLFERFVTMMRA